LGRLQIEVVCDLGSRDGADALRFRDAAPTAVIFAFEAHPGNFELMRTDARLDARRVEPVFAALSNVDGTAPFFLVDERYAPPEWGGNDAWRGMSSLHRRRDRAELLKEIEVPATRLDTFLHRRQLERARLALWIDTEGMAYQVVEGAANVLANAQLIHVEVETTHCIGTDQKLYADVKQRLLAAGLTELATDRSTAQVQLNALFIRWPRSAFSRAAVRFCLYAAVLRGLAGRVLRRLR
jgi:FkbM family methyltransferase